MCVADTSVGDRTVATDADVSKAFMRVHAGKASYFEEVGQRPCEKSTCKREVEEIPSTLEHQRMAVHLFVQAELMVQIVGLVVLIYPRPPDKVYKSYGMTLHP